MILVSKLIRHVGVWRRADKLIWKACSEVSGSLFFFFYFLLETDFLSQRCVCSYLISNHASARQKENREKFIRRVPRPGEFTDYSLRCGGEAFILIPLSKLSRLVQGFTPGTLLSQTTTTLTPPSVTCDLQW